MSLIDGSIPREIPEDIQVFLKNEKRVKYMGIGFKCKLCGWIDHNLFIDLALLEFRRHLTAHEAKLFDSLDSKDFKMWKKSMYHFIAETTEGFNETLNPEIMFEDFDINLNRKHLKKLHTYWEVVSYDHISSIIHMVLENDKVARKTLKNGNFREYIESKCCRYMCLLCGKEFLNGFNKPIIFAHLSNCVIVSKRLFANCEN